MILRDEAERAIRAWDAYERRRGTSPVIDYDCHPIDAYVEPATSRLEVLEQFKTLWKKSDDQEHPEVRQRLLSDITYLRAVLGERAPLNEYVEKTQGCSAAGWSEDYLMRRRDQARERLGDIGVGWHGGTAEEMSQVETPLKVEDVPDVVRGMVAEFEPQVRAITGSSAPFEISIENVHVDAYWSYWLDGAGEKARMRINLKNAVFTEVSARAFTLHEIFGHALQCASFSAHALEADVPWVRLCSVHSAQQVLLEGLAQALPMFVIPGDQRAMARLSFVHYTQLVRSDLHRRINTGTSVDDCVSRARSLVPFWTDENIGNILSDRSANPQLRSYLWAYPTGLDWFVALVESGSSAAADVLQASYRDPLAPDDLARLWPDGPKFGGDL